VNEAPATPSAAQEPSDLLGLDLAAFRAELRARGLKAQGLAAEVWVDALKRGAFEPERAGLVPRVAAAWRQAFFLRLPVPRMLVSEEGELGPTEKALVAMADGTEIEMVRIPMPPGPDGDERTTLCVSSQAGCRMGCAFCETGRGGLVRNLAPGEIVGQVLAARLLFGWNVRKLVFMGMGEPLDNFDGLSAALRVLLDSRGPAFSQERITVCTSGLSDAVGRLRGLGLKRLGLSVSLNASDDPTRTRLMRVNREHPLDKLVPALAAYPQRASFVLGVNYCLIPGLNDRPGDAARVAGIVTRLGRALVNVIPYNPGRAPIGRAPSEDEVEAFVAALEAEGVPVRRRATKGRSIMAACGQLGPPPA